MSVTYAKRVALRAPPNNPSITCTEKRNEKNGEGVVVTPECSLNDLIDLFSKLDYEMFCEPVR